MRMHEIQARQLVQAVDNLLTSGDTDAAARLGRQIAASPNGAAILLAIVEGAEAAAAERAIAAAPEVWM